MKNDLLNLVNELRKLPVETEWLEFKLSYAEPEKIGKYICALSNSACLHQQNEAYLIYGIDNKTHDIVGTTFNYKNSVGKGAEPLESWLVRNMKPVIEFNAYELDDSGKKILLFIIQPAHSGPVKFQNKAWIRIGTTTQPLDGFSEKEAIIWERRMPFETKTAKEGVSEEEILNLLNYDHYFRLTNQLPPKDQKGIVEKLVQEDFILKNKGRLHISNLGAISLAHDLNNFPRLKGKAVRVITYQDINRLNATKDVVWNNGYAAGFENIIQYIQSQIPDQEIIEGAIRNVNVKYPEKSIREFVANALVHQDFAISGFAPLIEIFDNRIEISNPGNPLIEPDRFMDHPPKSRNEKLTDKLRRMRICEKRGSGIDRAVLAIELAQLPAPFIEKGEDVLRVVIYSHKELSQLTKEDQCRACYYHSCIRHIVDQDFLTNNSLCKRLGIKEQNKAIASRIIKKSIEKKLIKSFDPNNKSNKYAKYLPYWA